MFRNYDIKTTLTIASSDDYGNSVVESTQEVYDFDKITEIVAKNYRVSRPQESCDALYIKDTGNIYLMEFKNTPKGHVPKNSVKKKAYDSIMTLMCAFCPEMSLEDMRKKVTFIFVYNNEAGHLQPGHGIEQMKKKLRELAGYPDNILFGLEIYKDVFYKEVYTIDRAFFEQNMMKEIF